MSKLQFIPNIHKWAESAALDFFFSFQYSSNKGETGFYFAMYLYPLQVRKTGLGPPLSSAKTVQ